MREMLCFGAQTVPRKVDGEALPRDGQRTVTGDLWLELSFQVCS